MYAQFEEDSPGGTYKSADVTANVPIYNNAITAPAVTSFISSGNPAIITGSTPNGGSGTFTYQWESSTASSSSGYSSISGATAISYDPPSSTIITTTYYRRKVTSGGLTGYSNVVSITISLAPVTNNTISYTGTASFADAGDPSNITGSSPSGGNGTYTYQWQLATLDAPSSFFDISGSTAPSYDPPTIQYTTYFRRKVMSGSAASYSNVITVTIVRTGATMGNPINIGNFDICKTYSSTLYNYPINGYGNEFGNSTDDIYYKFSLTEPAKVTLQNCKPDGVSACCLLFVKCLWKRNSIKFFNSL